MFVHDDPRTKIASTYLRLGKCNPESLWRRLLDCCIVPPSPDIARLAFARPIAQEGGDGGSKKEVAETRRGERDEAPGPGISRVNYLHVLDLLATGKIDTRIAPGYLRDIQAVSESAVQMHLWNGRRAIRVLVSGFVDYVNRDDCGQVSKPLSRTI